MIWAYVTLTIRSTNALLGKFCRNFQTNCSQADKTEQLTQVICSEFGCGDDANAWRKSTKEADKTKKDLESRNLFNHLRHQRTNSRQITSAKVFDYAACNWFNKFVCIISLWFSITWLCSSLMWSQDKEKWTKTIFRSERQIINGLF